MADGGGGGGDGGGSAGADSYLLEGRLQRANACPGRASDNINYVALDGASLPTQWSAKNGSGPGVPSWTWSREKRRSRYDGPAEMGC